MFPSVILIVAKGLPADGQHKWPSDAACSTVTVRSDKLNIIIAG